MLPRGLREDQASNNPAHGAIMNVTLATDPELFAKAQAYAQARNTTLDRIDCDYLERLTEKVDPQRAADEFATLAQKHSGCSEPGFKFDRHASTEY